MINRFHLGLLALLLPLAAQAQLLNGDFEDNNDTIAQNWLFPDFGAGVKTDYVHSGSHALAVWNWYYYSRGYAVNGTHMVSLFSNMQGAGTPATQKALRLTGYYYYDTTGTDTNNDTALITLAYRKSNNNNDYDTVAYGMKLFAPTLGSNMAPFSIDIDDWAPGTEPDTLLILVQSSLNGFCDPSASGNCLYFYVDDLKLETTTGTQNIMGQFTNLAQHPNPTTGTITLNAPAEGTLWQLYSLSGRLLQSQYLALGYNTIDIATQPAGIYLVQLSQNGTVVAREKLVKH